MADETFPALKTPNSENHGRNAGGHGKLTDRALDSGQTGLRLGMSFGFLVILLVVVGDQGMRRMDQINLDLKNLMDRQWTKVSLSREALALSNRNSRITMQVFLLRNRSQI